MYSMSDPEMHFIFLRSDNTISPERSVQTHFQAAYLYPANE